MVWVKDLLVVIECGDFICEFVVVILLIVVFDIMDVINLLGVLCKVKGCLVVVNDEFGVV